MPLRLLLLVLGLYLLATPGTAQRSLLMPLNHQKAYEKGTRSHSGKPGPNYWQNKAEYNIEASLNPSKHRIEGAETVVYTNNSPDTLRQLRLKLTHDLYRKGAQRGYDLPAADIDEGVELLQVQINGKTLAAKDQQRFATFVDLRLNQAPLLPGTSLTLKVKWAYTLPVTPGAPRECVCDKSTFFVPYWYPQVAVYDDLQGWASAPYTGLQEFYNDFSNYDVRITVPKGYMVWATGEWQNPLEILETPVFEKWNKAHQSNEVVSVFTEKDLKDGGIFKKAKQQVFHFRAEQVPDFAFATSDHYNWDATSVVVDQRSGRRTFISAAYNTKSQDYYRVADIAAKGIRLMSEWLPGYPFPYPVMTVFNGDDGMEYPMMCNDASTGDNDPTGLTVHEISHTYFPFMMGVNEQDYAWMDEGWAAFFDYLLTDSLSNHRLGGVRGYGQIAGTDNDVPPMVRARNLSTAYRNASYQRPQVAYLGLLDLLGYDTFRYCMNEYMNRWKGKHPAPFDFFNTWNEASGQNLDWYWKPWFFDWGYPDLALQRPSRNEAANCQIITIERKGNQPVPVYLKVTYTDGSTDTITRRASVWKDGKSILTIPAAVGKTIRSAELGHVRIPDTNLKDNKI
jgi:hypothetical protein